MEQSRVFYYPLTARDFQALRQGKRITKHYHILPDKLLVVIAWNKDLTERLEKSRFEAALRAGIDIANIPLTTEALTKLAATNDGIEVRYEGFKILAISTETLAKLQKEKERSVELLWKRYQLDDHPQTCHICGNGVTVENCGAMAFGWYGETIVCCKNPQDLRHFEIFISDKMLNWIKFEEQ